MSWPILKTTAGVMVHISFCFISFLQNYSKYMNNYIGQLGNQLFIEIFFEMKIRYKKTPSVLQTNKCSYQDACVFSHAGQIILKGITYRRSRKTLKTSKASVTLLTSVTSVSMITFVTSRSLGSLEIGSQHGYCLLRLQFTTVLLCVIVFATIWGTVFYMN